MPGVAAILTIPVIPSVVWLHEDIGKDAFGQARGDPGGVLVDEPVARRQLAQFRP
jgi:hypothetical protein